MLAIPTKIGDLNIKSVSHRDLQIISLLPCGESHSVVGIPSLGVCPADRIKKVNHI